MMQTLLSRRAFLTQAGLAAMALHSGVLHALATSLPVTVRTPLGLLRGEESGGVRVFRGVPFAEPPVGPLRFRPPVRMKPWKGERDVTHFAPAAIQPGLKSTPQSENCLYLNLWAPQGKGPFPVYVWIHGGGFTSGRSFDPMFDGTELAREGVICVTVAYRLGIFGFLDMEPLLGTGYVGSANNGLRDLIAALEWVRENIAEFGGDPTHVTVGGESAGAKLTDILLGTPSAQPLFRQAISESGGAERLATRTESEAVGRGFSEEWRADTENKLSALLTAPADALLLAQRKFIHLWPQHFPLRAEIDGKLVPRWPVDTIAMGMSRGKRLLIGTNRDESTAFVGPHPQKDPGAADLGNLPVARFDEVFRKYKKIYPQMTEEQRRIRALTAEEYWVPSVRVANAHVKSGGSTWMYRLDFAESSGQLRGFAFHALDLRLVWDRPSAQGGNAATEAALARTMHRAWVAFLKGEAPEAPGLPAWPEYKHRTQDTMLFDTVSRMERRPQKSELRLWKDVL
jgi:para-nitrobenzyl esterase